MEVGIVWHNPVHASSEALSHPPVPQVCQFTDLEAEGRCAAPTGEEKTEDRLL